MKVIFIAILFCSVLWAEGFTTYKVIKKDTPIDEIIKTMTNAPDGMVIFFEEGEYDFKGAIIVIKNKKHIGLNSLSNKKMGVNLLNVYIKFIKSDYINISNLQLESKENNQETESYIGFSKCNNINVSKLIFKNALLRIFDSTGIVKHIDAQIDSHISTNFLYIDNSKVIVEKSRFLTNNKSDTMIFKNSYIKINNNLFINASKAAIYAEYSRILVTNNTFGDKRCYLVPLKNKSFAYVIDGQFYSSPTKEQKKICIAPTFKFNGVFDARSIAISKGYLIAKNNNFFHQDIAILSTKSKSYISKNVFDSFATSIVVYDQSNAYIDSNIMRNGTSKQSEGISVFDKSIASIHQNQISNVAKGIELGREAKANIIDNTILNLQLNKYKSSTGSYKMRSGIGINVNSGCQANIKNTKYNSENTYCGYASEKSLVYLENNDNGFELPGILNNQKTDKPLNIEVSEVEDFKKEFDAIKAIQINYKSLKNYNDQKNTKKTEVLSAETKDVSRGNLDESIIVTTKEGFEDEIEKGTYVVFDKTNSLIIEPNEYQGIELDTPPKLSVSSKNRNIELKSNVIKKDDKYYVQLVIESNVNIVEISFKKKPVSFKSTSATTYETKPRRIKTKYIGHSYPLLIKGENFSEAYGCKIESLSSVECSKKEKLDGGKI